MVRAQIRVFSLLARPRKQPAQLNRSGQLAALLVRGADRSGLSLGDDEHPWQHGGRVAGQASKGPARIRGEMHVTIVRWRFDASRATTDAWAQKSLKPMLGRCGVDPCRG
jgi:hypothetical protein